MKKKAGICSASKHGLIYTGDSGQIKQILFIQKLFHTRVT